MLGWICCLFTVQSINAQQCSMMTRCYGCWAESAASSPCNPSMLSNAPWWPVATDAGLNLLPLHRAIHQCSAKLHDDPLLRMLGWICHVRFTYSLTYSVTGESIEYWNKTGSNYCYLTREWFKVSSPMRQHHLCWGEDQLTTDMLTGSNVDCVETRVYPLKQLVIYPHHTTPHHTRSLNLTIQCESKQNPPWGDLTFFHFFHKWLRIFLSIFTHLLHVRIYTRLQIFIQLSPTLTKLCHIKCDYPVHIICSKCPPSAETHTFRRLRKSLIALLIVVCGKSL